MKRARPKDWSATELMRLKSMARRKLDAQQIALAFWLARWINQKEVAELRVIPRKR